MTIKKYAVIIALTFAVAFCTQYLASVNNIFAADWSTIQLCISSGIVAVFGWFVAYAASLKKELESIKATNAALVKAVNARFGANIS
jgi:hypothetical protein